MSIEEFATIRGGKRGKSHADAQGDSGLATGTGGRYAESTQETIGPGCVQEEADGTVR